MALGERPYRKLVREGEKQRLDMVGGCTSRMQFDPQLETARFQPLSLPLDPS
jgi:hypothetical protein